MHRNSRVILDDLHGFPVQPIKKRWCHFQPIRRLHPWGKSQKRRLTRHLVSICLTLWFFSFSALLCFLVSSEGLCLCLLGGFIFLRIKFIFKLWVFDLSFVIYSKTHSKVDRSTKRQRYPNLSVVVDSVALQSMPQPTTTSYYSFFKQTIFWKQ